MPARTPPRWFQERLSAVDARLTVYWHDALCRWVIAERVPRVVFVGTREGMVLHHMKPRLERVFLVDDLGSGLLDWLRRACMDRFESIAEMVKGLDLDTMPDPKVDA